jgi:molybdate transport system substrate-binding protein
MTLLCCTAGCGRTPDTPALSVFAAASLADVIAECTREYEARHAGVRVSLNFAGSSTLARQLDAGAPCDVFISANAEWVDWLLRRGRLDADSISVVASNRLVLIVPKGRGFAMPPPDGAALDRMFAGRLALGDPQHVPAGSYARQALTSLGWWEGVKQRIAPTLDVRAALKLVEQAEVDAGIVYATDARGDDRVEVVWTFPSESHSPIQYLAAQSAASSSKSSRAAEFLSLLRSARGREIFRQDGFVVNE